MCHCMHDSQSMRTEMPTAMSSFVFFASAPSVNAAASIARNAS